jgi:hypothetical protein
MDASNILQVITLAVAGWTLREVISQGKDLAKVKQKMKDLPCGECDYSHD